jgi:cobalt-zinc-cadmium resistance protein CzcA
MFSKLIQFSIKQRLLVIASSIFMGIWGAYNFLILPIDAVPDITNVQVQINTEAPGFTPLEVEQRITFPVETVIAGLPKLKNTRSLSRYGLSQVTAIFEDGTDIYFARQLTHACKELKKFYLKTQNPLLALSLPDLARFLCGLSSDKTILLAKTRNLLL